MSELTTEYGVLLALKRPSLSGPRNSDSEKATIRSVKNVKNTLTRPLVFEDFSPLYTLTAWKEPKILTSRIAVALVFHVASREETSLLLWFWLV